MRCDNAVAIKYKQYKKYITICACLRLGPPELEMNQCESLKKCSSLGLGAPGLEMKQLETCKKCNSLSLGAPEPEMNQFE